MCLLTCVLVMAAVAIQRDGRVAGHDLTTNKGDTPAAKAVRADMKNASVTNGTVGDSVRTLADGAVVVNTTTTGKYIKGYAGPVPLEITIRNGRIAEVKALPNTETPEFFDEAKTLLDQWNGMTVNEAATAEIDAVSGATFSSRAIINNVRRGLQSVESAGNGGSFLDRLDLSPKSIAGLIVVLLGTIVPLFVHSRRFRMVQLVLNVVVLGLWCGTFLSYSLMVGYMANGLDVWLSLIPTVMLVCAFVYPLFGKKQYYCTHICPFGSAQELAGMLNRRHKWKMSPRTTKGLTVFREVLWGVLMLLMLCGVGFKWMDYELFTAFIFRSASVVVIVLAVVVLILSVFVPRPYCRFICPTGTLFKAAQGENSKTNHQH